MTREVTGPSPGATALASSVWPTTDPRFLRWQRTVVLGAGDSAWHVAREALLTWGVKTRSGFVVEPPGVPEAGSEVRITARVLGVRVVEPALVLAVLDTPARAGIAYGTLAGHPVAGEEAFIVHHDGDAVLLTIRSLTAPASSGPWRLAYPLLLIAQRMARRRYLRALR